jgi:putative toxin-antitoxin system antitoxin component (TIGR02293 family)
MTVAAITAVLGGKQMLRRTVETDSELRVITRGGLPVGTLPVLAEKLAVERKTLARVVGISDRTLSRRIADGGRLTAEESDRTVRLARVFAMALDTFGGEEKASSWLRRPNRVLEGQPPLELLDTDAGVQSVETVLMRINYGIFS